MSNGIGFFDEAAATGGRILDYLAGTSPSGQVEAYLRRLADIYTLMVSIHDMVTDIAVEAGLADDIHAAHHALSRIDRQNLEAVFRARNWCDELESLGHALRPLADSSSLAASDSNTWSEFTDKLQMREGEVAVLYEDKLHDLLNLRHHENDLQALRQKVDAIADELVKQKARFDLMAKRARAMARQAGLN